MSKRIQAGFLARGPGRSISLIILAAIGLLLGASSAWARPKAKSPEVVVPLTATGQKLEAQYAATLAALKAEITNALPVVAEQKETALLKSREAIAAAAEKANATQQALGKISGAKGLVEHAKGKWIGGANKGIADAEAALKKATTDAQREEAKKELAHWQANKEEGIKALKERQAALDKLKIEEPSLIEANQSAQSVLKKAQAEELNAAKALLADVEKFLSSDKLDASLVKCMVLTAATPRGLAEFAQQGPKQQALVEQLLADDKLMKDMLVAGGAKFGKYGRAMEIYSAIQQASPKASQGTLQRLALATSLEHAVPIKQSNAAVQTDAPAVVDPVNRYLHYEKAFEAGELDPAFKDFTTWEYRMVVDCDAPDEILAWGREMLRTYRPDHTYTPDYGWRYSAAVRTEVRYGSQCVKDDQPLLHNYQNILKNGGVCGRRAFFGRFILQSFGVPVWGVTQHKHAALSHWTPKGWVINLGAGFHASWWDKDEVPRSGSDFLLETQAREHGQDYLKVLRAQWVSRILGEQAHNDRRKVPGGFWSNVGHDQAVVMAATAVELGPLGQELAEANEPQEKVTAQQTSASDAEQKIVVGRDGVISIPAVARNKPTGPSSVMKSYAGGMQLHCSGGFKTQYVFEAPRSGKYALTARVATVQDGQKLVLSANDAKEQQELAVPYTIGVWQQTQPVEIPLLKGQNVLHFALQEGSRGVSIKDLTLTPVK